MGGPTADPLVEILTEIVRHDIAATRTCCKVGVGIVGMSTPNTLAKLNQVIAPVCPSLQLKRVSCARGEAPVVCFRGPQRVMLDQLDAAERAAIHIAAALDTAAVRDGVILVDRPEQHVQREAGARWLDWLTALAAGNQLFVTIPSPG